MCLYSLEGLAVIAHRRNMKPHLLVCKKGKYENGPRIPCIHLDCDVTFARRSDAKRHETRSKHNPKCPASRKHKCTKDGRKAFISPISTRARAAGTGSSRARAKAVNWE